MQYLIDIRQMIILYLGCSCCLFDGMVTDSCFLYMAEHGLGQCEKSLHIWRLLSLAKSLLSHRLKTGPDIMNIITANTQSNKHVIITSKQHFDVIITCLLRCVFAGIFTLSCWNLCYVGHGKENCHIDKIPQFLAWSLQESNFLVQEPNYDILRNFIEVYVLPIAPIADAGCILGDFKSNL